MLYAYNHGEQNKDITEIFTNANSHENDTILVKDDEEKEFIPRDLYGILFNFQSDVVDIKKRQAMDIYADDQYKVEERQFWPSEIVVRPWVSKEKWEKQRPRYSRQPRRRHHQHCQNDNTERWDYDRFDDRAPRYGSRHHRHDSHTGRWDGRYHDYDTYIDR